MLTLIVAALLQIAPVDLPLWLVLISLIIDLLWLISALKSD